MAKSNGTERQQKDGGAGTTRSRKRPQSTMSAQLAVLSLILAILAVSALKIGAVVFLPIVLSIILAFLFTPVNRALGRLRIPPPVAAAIIVAAIIGTIAYGTYRLAEPAQAWVKTAPALIDRVELRLRELLRPFEAMTEATEQVQEMTAPNDDLTPTVKVQDSSSPNVLRQGAGFLAAVAIVSILLYFFLASGDLFLGKLMELQTQRSAARHVVEVVHAVQHDISSYLFTISTINVCLGIAIGVAMHLLDMPNPILWGVMATLLNFIPYVGAIVGITVVGVVAFDTFETVNLHAAAVPFAYFVCTAIEGYFVTPIVVGRRLRLNPVAIIIGLIFWSWLWGIPGALLTVPLLSIIKSLCDEIEPLKPVALFLGR